MELMFGKQRGKASWPGWALIIGMQSMAGSAAILYVSQSSLVPAAPYATWTTAAQNIQDAIDVASAGDEIIVTNGIYANGGRVVYEKLTNRVAVTKAVIIRSVNGPTVTIIEGHQVPGNIKGDNAVRCAYLTNDAVLAGFTLRNGATRTNGTHHSESNGGGVWCESVDCVISNCVLNANVSDLVGGGAYQGTLYDCVISGNRASLFNEGGGGGGGVSRSIANRCVISNNVSAGVGGGAHDATLNDCVVVANILQGRYLWRFDGGGASFCNLTGCTIANNTGSGAYRSTLDHCTILGNGRGIEESGATASTISSNAGLGAIYCSLTNCTLTGNSDAGAQSCTLVRCTLSKNIGAGAGPYNTGYNCIITHNGLGADRYCELYNCAIANNRGLGAWLSRLANCTVTGNIGGADSCEVNNSIVCYNFSPVAGFDNYDTNSTFNYSCTTPLPGSGSGNISLAPQLASTSHLTAGSPCRGAGNSIYTTELDIDGQSWANPPSMGCDEYLGAGPPEALTVAIEASFLTVATGFEVKFTATFSGLVTSSLWDFGDGTIEQSGAFGKHHWSSGGDFPVIVTAFNPAHAGGVSATAVVHVVASPIQYVSAAASNPVAPFTAWETAAATIQDAVDAAIPGGTILVTNGFYATGGKVIGGPTNRVGVTVELHLRSVNGPTATFIVGERPDEEAGATETIRCVYLANGATLSGFTLTNGMAGWPADDNDDNQDESLDSGGGVLCESINVVITNCVFVRNFASASGGGVYGGTLRNCVLRDNYADYGGGAEESVLQQCILTGNYGNEFGAANACDLKGCLVYGNWTSGYGGAVNASILNNCTVSRNTAVGYLPAGVSFSSVTNSIIYENYAGFAQAGVSNVVNSMLAYSCTFPLPASGSGIITNSPLFTDAGSGNFHLQPGSPCIDTGLDLTGIIGRDLDGNTRPLDGNRDGIVAFDMGAYEFNGLCFMSATRVGSKVKLVWYDAPPGMKLQRASAIPGTSWIDVPIAPGQLSTEFSADDGAAFFRLMGP